MEVPQTFLYKDDTIGIIEQWSDIKVGYWNSWLYEIQGISVKDISKGDRWKVTYARGAKVRTKIEPVENASEEFWIYFERHKRLPDGNFVNVHTGKVIYSVYLCKLDKAGGVLKKFLIGVVWDERETIAA